MSDIRAWPVGLNYRPLQAGYKWKPHDPQLRTAMEQGPARKRRRWIASPAYITVAWPFSLREFEVFRAWHHLQLDDGANWFRLNVFTGTDWQLLPVRFKGVYRPTLKGLIWTVSADIEVRQVPFVSVEDEPSIDVRAWPEAVNPLPIRDTYQMSPHRPVVRGDIDGPQDTKLWYQDGATSSDFQWPMTPDQFELFRAWYHTALRDGVSWFTAPAWVGGLFGTRRCRFGEAYEAELQADGQWLVAAAIDMRDLPYLDDGLLYISTLIGDETYQTEVGNIHHFIHTTYPEATS